MIAAITLKMLDPFGTGKLVLFQVTYDKDWHAYELIPFLLLGVFGVSCDDLVDFLNLTDSDQGVYGAYFSKLNYRWSKHVRAKTWVGRHPVIEVLLVGLYSMGHGLQGHTCSLGHWPDRGPLLPKPIHSHGRDGVGL